MLLTGNKVHNKMNKAGFLFDFYLSEMSVSDFHGGGLTIQRILGEDIDKIDLFAHVSRFATDLPANEKILSRCFNLSVPWESNAVKRIIGSTMTSRLSRNGILLKKRAAISANVLHKKLGKSKEDVRALVCPQGINALLTMEELKKRRPVRYVSWVMDDHLVRWTNGKWNYSAGVKEIFGKHLREAKHVFVISSVMQEFYLKTFAVKSTVLFGSSDSENEDIQPAINPNSTLKLGYFGAVAEWQLDALEAVGKALTAANAQLDIYSGVIKLPIELHQKGIFFKGKLKPDEVLPTMRAYDAILLPMSFRSKLRNMSEFNIATKLSECLASGIPTIAVGPEYAAMIQFLKIHDAAIISTSEVAQDIAKSLEILRDRETITSILNNAHYLVKHHLGSAPMRAKWSAFSNI